MHFIMIQKYTLNQKFVIQRDSSTRFRKPETHYFPFGYGLRNCIGERMGILQAKIGLIGILRNYKIDVCEETVTSYRYVINRFVTAPSTDIFIKMTKVN
ncbi:PREDICTED: probable cytochrome P450 6w1 [Dinoponera quadriceps]|uniref:Probable cytochrome P450 6w1 n=1 Tax=Dinoponera quadriceps TaxID=609295 RepID=A0A6P3WWD5_DINQU|nr:PREDICTED: probable cytochrome P450 6w1 [Dinoponera quadriceps]